MGGENYNIEKECSKELEHFFDIETIREYSQEYYINNVEDFYPQYHRVNNAEFYEHKTIMYTDDIGNFYDEKKFIKYNNPGNINEKKKIVDVSEEKKDGYKETRSLRVNSKIHDILNEKYKNSHYRVKNIVVLYIPQDIRLKNTTVYIDGVHIEQMNVRIQIHNNRIYLYDGIINDLEEGDDELEYCDKSDTHYFKTEIDVLYYYNEMYTSTNKKFNEGIKLDFKGNTFYLRGKFLEVDAGDIIEDTEIGFTDYIVGVNDEGYYFHDEINWVNSHTIKIPEKFKGYEKLYVKYLDKVPTYYKRIIDKYLKDKVDTPDKIIGSRTEELLDVYDIRHIDEEELINTIKREDYGLYNFLKEKILGEKFHYYELQELELVVDNYKEELMSGNVVYNTVGDKSKLGFITPKFRLNVFNPQHKTPEIFINGKLYYQDRAVIHHGDYTSVYIGIEKLIDNPDWQHPPIGVQRFKDYLKDSKYADHVLTVNLKEKDYVYENVFSPVLKRRYAFNKKKSFGGGTKVKILEGYENYEEDRSYEDYEEYIIHPDEESPDFDFLGEGVYRDSQLNNDYVKPPWSDRGIRPVESYQGFMYLPKNTGDLYNISVYRNGKLLNENEYEIKSYLDEFYVLFPKIEPEQHGVYTITGYKKRPYIIEREINPKQIIDDEITIKNQELFYNRRNINHYSDEISTEKRIVNLDFDDEDIIKVIQYQRDIYEIKQLDNKYDYRDKIIENHKLKLKDDLDTIEKEEFDYLDKKIYQLHQFFTKYVETGLIDPRKIENSQLKDQVCEEFDELVDEEGNITLESSIDGFPRPLDYPNKFLRIWQMKLNFMLGEYDDYDFEELPVELKNEIENKGRITVDHHMMRFLRTKDKFL